jgi:hypothetical protein
MYKAPLHIFVLWHPKFKQGLKFAEDIYSQYTRRILEPLARGIGIPVFFRSNALKGEYPTQIDLSQAENNAIVILVDDNAVIEWREYIDNINSQVEADTGDNRIFPVSLTANFAKAGENIAKRNFIRLHTEKNSFDKRSKLLLSQLTHELCRMLLDKPRIAEKQNSTTKLSPAPVSLFISHAKRDGEQIAVKIKAYTDAHKAMETFFDRVDIASGFKFKEEIEGNIEKSALLVVQTDSYSSREWCRWEVLNAKKVGKPVVVINAIEEGEERSFPYLGNVPTIRWKKISNKRESEQIERILNFGLYEILRYIYTEMYLTSLNRLNSITGTKRPKILSSPPELLTLLEKSVDTKTKGKIVIYPDPPLTAEEMKLLNEVSDDYAYLTPTLLLAYNEVKDNE